MMWLANL